MRKQTGGIEYNADELKEIARLKDLAFKMGGTVTHAQEGRSQYGAILAHTMHDPSGYVTPSLVQQVFAPPQVGDIFGRLLFSKAGMIGLVGYLGSTHFQDITSAFGWKTVGDVPGLGLLTRTVIDPVRQVFGYTDLIYDRSLGAKNLAVVHELEGKSNFSTPADNLEKMKKGLAETKSELDALLKKNGLPIQETGSEQTQKATTTDASRDYTTMKVEDALRRGTSGSSQVPVSSFAAAQQYVAQPQAYPQGG